MYLCFPVFSTTSHQSLGSYNVFDWQQHCCSCWGTRWKTTAQQGLSVVLRYRSVKMESSPKLLWFNIWCKSYILLSLLFRGGGLVQTVHGIVGILLASLAAYVDVDCDRNSNTKKYLFIGWCVVKLYCDEVHVQNLVHISQWLESGPVQKCSPSHRNPSTEWDTLQPMTPNFAVSMCMVALKTRGGSMMSTCLI